MFWLDVSLLLFLIGFATLAPRPLYRLLFRFGNLFDRVARHRRLSVVLIGLFSFLLNASLSLFVRMPEPFCTDEQAYLFTADTFAQGRLTNPPPPFVDHFRAPELLVQPSYQAKYPPAQGAALALGQVLTGHPIVGVWLSLAIGCAAVCWMLQAWLPARWALVGGVLTVVNPWIVSSWGLSYWGGAVAMTGGALVFGALRRIMACPRTRDSLLLAVGLGLLANSRPYEGLVASIPVAVTLLVWMVRSPTAKYGVVVRRVVVPVVLGLTPTFGWMAYYNLQVTGDPVKLPYQAWTEAARPGESVGDLLWHSRTLDAAARQKHLAVQRRSLFNLWMFYLRIPLVIPLLFLPCALRTRWTAFAFLCVALMVLALMFQMSYAYPHYAAPVACLIVYLVVQGLRQLRTRRIGGRPVGRIAVAVFPLLYAGSSAVFLAQGGDWYPKPGGPPTRVQYEQELEATAGDHLVFIRDRRPRNERLTDWGYNRADFENARIIWVRDLGATKNLEVLGHYANRTAWLLVADVEPPRLIPYSVPP